MTDEKKKRRRLPVDLGDFASFGGVGLIIYGAYTIYQPAAAILGGLLLLGMGISIHRHKSRNRSS